MAELFGMPVKIAPGLPENVVIIGEVTIILQGHRPVDALIDGVVIKLGDGNG